MIFLVSSCKIHLNVQNKIRRTEKKLTMPNRQSRESVYKRHKLLWETNVLKISKILLNMAKLLNRHNSLGIKKRPPQEVSIGNNYKLCINVL